MFTRAIVRPPSDTFAQGITTAGLGRPDSALAREQHAAYCRALESCGLDVSTLPPLPEYPDSCFVEDTAVLLPELAVINSFGAESRRGEEAGVAEWLAGVRPLWRVAEAGNGARLEGGDVLQVGEWFFVGLSARTNRAGAEAFGRAVAAHGYRWATLEVGHPPHLKTSLTWVGGRSLVMTAELADRPELAEYDRIVTDPEENYAACCLFLNGTILMPAGHPSTRAKLMRLDRPLIEVEMSEFAKMDGGLTCLSLRY